jgi:diadenosine tetraphosphatase ApaH/serine/threonine PP2A family protein phosphatase
LIINPGSVGQPRDGDVRAAYAILDVATNSLEHRRVPYRINLTQQKMKQRQFPPRLWQRLAFGE